MQIQTIKNILLIFACTLCISACATNATGEKSVRYLCDRGTDLHVGYTKKGFTTMRGGRNSMHRYEERNVAANITLQDGTLIILPVQKAASGFMFSNGRYTFSSQNNEVMWSVGKMAAERCEVRP